MENIYSIYEATCLITGKSYIGFDSAWPTRKTDHKRESKKEKYNTKFYNAIRKYGWNNFTWRLLYQSKDFKYCLEVMEPYFIQERNSLKLNDGYNMTPGGDGKKFGSFESEEVKGKKSLAHSGKTVPPEHVAKIKASRLANKGYAHSEETKKKLSLSRIGKAPWNKNRITERCSCIICHKEVDRFNLGRHHKHLPKTNQDSEASF